MGLGVCAVRLRRHAVRGDDEAVVPLDAEHRELVPRHVVGLHLAARRPRVDDRLALHHAVANREVDRLLREVLHAGVSQILRDGLERLVVGRDPPRPGDGCGPNGVEDRERAFAALPEAGRHDAERLDLVRRETGG